MYSGHVRAGVWGCAARRRFVQLVLACAVFLPSTSCQGRAAARVSGAPGASEWGEAFDDGIPVSTYKVLKRLDHDSTAFTQGLEFDANGLLVEGTGLYGQSQLRRASPDDPSKVIQKKAIGKKYFGEGLTIVDEYVVQLTWKERKAFVYDKESFARKGSFSFPYQGWGLARHKEKGLVSSDGSNVLRFWERVPDDASDPDTGKSEDKWWKETSSKPLQMPDGREVSQVLWRTPEGQTVRLDVRLNELENVGGEVWANLWPTETIVRIDAQSAVIKGWIDMRGLRDEALALAQQKGKQVDVLNGIAYRAASEESSQMLIVTGKWWPLAFNVDIVASLQQASSTPASKTTSVADTCAWKGFPEGASARGEVVAAIPSSMRDVPEIDFGM